MSNFLSVQANQRYPHQLKLPSNYQCLFDEDGGILLAARCVAAFQVRLNEQGIMGTLTH